MTLRVDSDSDPVLTVCVCTVRTSASKGITDTTSMTGLGCPSHRLEMAQEPMRCIDTLTARLDITNTAAGWGGMGCQLHNQMVVRHPNIQYPPRGRRAPAESTMSLEAVLSPDRFPSTHITCSRTYSIQEQWLSTRDYPVTTHLIMGGLQQGDQYGGGSMLQQ